MFRNKESIKLKVKNKEPISKRMAFYLHVFCFPSNTLPISREEWEQCSNFKVQTSTNVEALSMDVYSNKNFKAARLQFTHNVTNIWSKQCWLCTATMVKNLYLHIIDTHVCTYTDIKSIELFFSYDITNITLH